MNGGSISVIIPTYNEAGTIGHLAERINNILGKDFPHEILVVDDNSPDNTAEIVENLPKAMNTRLISRTENRSLSRSVVEGLKQAKNDIAIVMDADLSHPPEMLLSLLSPIAEGHCEISIGSRLVQGGNVENWPWHRKMISAGAILLSRPLTDVRDSMSGFFAVRMDSIDPQRLDPIGYKILLDILVRCRPLRVVEVPYTFRNREVGKSKLGFKEHIDYLMHVSKLYSHMAISRFK